VAAFAPIKFARLLPMNSLSGHNERFRGNTLFRLWFGANLS
jgi:hypothetical protein